MRRILFSMGAVACALMALSVPDANAGGPSMCTATGSPVRWANPGQIPYNPDNGPLGVLSKEQAAQFVKDSFGKWAGVATTSARFVNKGTLPVDVNVSNAPTYLSKPNGKNPIIFDHDGSIIDAAIGEGASDLVLGFAAPYVVNGVITEGLALLNGKFVDTTPHAEEFRATLIHEFGHYIGLAHSQINSFAAWNGSTADDTYLPTMYPTSTDNDLPLRDLNADDIAWVSELYPLGGTTLGAIEGRIASSSGSSVDGINVIARSATDPFVTAVSAVSGYRYPSASAKGLYRLPKLKAGYYTVGIDQVLPGFKGGSRIAPFDPPKKLLGPMEYYNGKSESGSTTTDRPDEAQTINVKSGSKVTGINITVNSSWPAPASVTEREPNNTLTNAQILKGGARISGSISNTDTGDISLSTDYGDDDFEDLYLLQPGNAANIRVKVDPVDNTQDLDVLAFYKVGTQLSLFAYSAHMPSFETGNEGFGPMDIGKSGAYIGVSFWEDPPGTTKYTLTIDVTRYPMGVATLSPSTLRRGQRADITIDGSNFASGLIASFPGSTIKVNSTTYVSANRVKVNVTVPSTESLGGKTIKITNSNKQPGLRASALTIQ